ncbi:arylsulfatase [Pontibacter qinzhouensis]|uniref:Arylsulfatase n=1 Tax=Pontibacter qinzhouensis TaxID=2603253 RepID=A0A5C8K8C1_9BACT|nr:arylsulfatase [Pontibacter qinzhouensis]TXK49359.1 arylsulfatase [Pontibacter qinzhouensis]
MRVKSSIFIKSSLPVLAVLVMFACTRIGQKEAESTEAERPNVVLILTDDLGYSDIGAYGSEINTPNLDALAASGVRFKEFYNVGICAPTRAALLTGQYNHNAGIGHFSSDLGNEYYQGYIRKNVPTIAEVLRANGYNTLMSGKWHVGSDSLQGPSHRGFDNFYGFLGGASVFFAHSPNTTNLTALNRNDQKITAPDDPSFYLTDAITDEAIQMIGSTQKPNNPFFLYLAYNAPHWPLQAMPEDIAKYKGRYNTGWDNLSEARFQKQLELGIVDKGFVKPERPSTIPAWTSLSEQDRQEWAARMEVHAAMIDRMDQNLGKLIAYLKQSGQYDNTIFFFMSDNGAAGEEMTRNQAGDSKPVVGTADSYYSITHHWAYAANTPFSYWKSIPYEGGLSSPFIASFPKAFNQNRIVTGRGHLIDILPTILEATRSTYLQEINGNQTRPLAGKSLVPLLSGNSTVSHDTLFFEWGGNRAVRAGDWKLLALRGSPNWKLYNIKTDRGETKDVAAANPGLVNDLKGTYLNWAKANHVTNTDSLLHVTQNSMLQFQKRIEQTIPKEVL